MAQDDARLQPFLILINAAANPEADNSQSIKEAIAQMVTFTEGALIPAMATVSISKLPFFEHGHRSYDDVQKIKVGSNESVWFANWGNTVEFKTGHTLEVNTVQGVCDIVKWAKGNGKRVRVAGFRHTWRCVRCIVDSTGTNQTFSVAISTVKTATSSLCFCLTNA